MISNLALTGESSSSSIPLPVIGGIVIALVISLLACIVIVVIIVKKRSRHSHTNIPKRSAVNSSLIASYNYNIYAGLMLLV